MAGRKVLLVEGVGDKIVIERLCDIRNVSRPEPITALGSVEQLLADFPIQLKESAEVVGVVIDADTDLNSRWMSLRDRLVEAGYTVSEVPKNPDPKGTIINPPSDPDKLLPRVGIWIMPNNQTTGILEDFLRFLVPADSPLFAHVKSSVSSIPAGERRFKDAAEPKALIHTWLAWQEKPGKPLGTAITAKFLNTEVPEVDVFVSWLKRLFSE